MIRAKPWTIPGGSKLNLTIEQRRHIREYLTLAAADYVHRYILDPKQKKCSRKLVVEAIDEVLRRKDVYDDKWLST